jgi:hypothetical protein
MICGGRDILRLMSHGHFAGQPVRPDIVRFVSVLSRAPARDATAAPVPPAGYDSRTLGGQEHRAQRGHLS